jgi:uncharacterized protein (TIGR03083 family)
MPDAYVVRNMVAAEQREFADLLRSMTRDEWEGPSLCAGWSMHDTVIHIAIHSHTGSFERFLKLARVRLSEDRLHEQERRRSRGELIAWLESPAELDRENTLVQLSELMIHHQDVRRPLGATRDIPAERLAAVLDFGITRFGSPRATSSGMGERPHVRPRRRASHTCVPLRQSDGSRSAQAISSGPFRRAASGAGRGWRRAGRARR